MYVTHLWDLVSRWDLDFVERHSCYKIKGLHFCTFDETCKTCKTCKHIHATKSKTGTFGLLMRLVKLVKLVHTFMLQNQRLKKTLYRIDFNGNLYRIILDGLAQKVMNFDVFQSSDLDFVACKNLPCQTLCLWKVLGFVESRILAGRAEFDLVIGPFGTWPWGPLQNRGAQQGPPNCKGDIICMITSH